MGFKCFKKVQKISKISKNLKRFQKIKNDNLLEAIFEWFWNVIGNQCGCKIFSFIFTFSFCRHLLSFVVIKLIFVVVAVICCSLIISFTFSKLLRAFKLRIFYHSINHVDQIILNSLNKLRNYFLNLAVYVYSWMNVY